MPQILRIAFDWDDYSVYDALTSYSNAFTNREMAMLYSAIDLLYDRNNWEEMFDGDWHQREQYLAYLLNKLQIR